MSKEIVLLVLGFSLIACGAFLLHGVYRYTRARTDSVEVWLVWCIAGMVAALGFGGAGAAVWQGFGAAHPEDGIALGAGALGWCWTFGIFMANQAARRERERRY